MTEYRYLLERRLTGPLVPTDYTVLFVMLNPSTADDRWDDPTIRRCRWFGQRLGATELRVVNLYAARATNPNWLRDIEDPVGPLNNATILEEAKGADMIVLAWGALANKAQCARAERVKMLLRESGADMYRLGDPTKDGHPRHPLYLAKDAPIHLMEL